MHLLFNPLLHVSAFSAIFRDVIYYCKKILKIITYLNMQYVCDREFTVLTQVNNIVSCISCNHYELDERHFASLFPQIPHGQQKVSNKVPIVWAA